MQYDQQEICYGPNPQSNASESVEYLNPMKLCENEHIFKVGADNDELKGLTPEEAQ